MSAQKSMHAYQPYSGAFSSEVTPSPEPQLKKRKRQRPIISCSECHRRKQKCDRQFPCGNCTLRSACHLCQYESRPSLRTSRSSSPKSIPNSPTSSNSPMSTFSSTPERTSFDLENGFGYAHSGMIGDGEMLVDMDLENTSSSGGESVICCPAPVGMHPPNRLVINLPPRPISMVMVKVFPAVQPTLDVEQYSYGTGIMDGIDSNDMWQNMVYLPPQ